jgi:hypothetical protein
MFDWLKGYIKEDKPREPKPIGGVNPDKALELIRSGKAEPGLYTFDMELYDRDAALPLPEGFKASSLTIGDGKKPIWLPEKLSVFSLNLRNCSCSVYIPDSIDSGTIHIENCPGLERLPRISGTSWVRISKCPNLRKFSRYFYAYELEIEDCAIDGLSDNVRVRDRLVLRNLPNLERIPSMEIQSLTVSNCPKLKYLPDNLEVEELDLSGSTGFQWRESELVLTHRLDLSDCVQITEIPYWVWVEDSIDIANTGLTEIPKELAHCRLLWRGMDVDERLALHPEMITGADILEESNIEVKRFMLERMGFNRFLSEVDSEMLDKDRDPGGERQLIRIEIGDFEPLVLLSVLCPSTERRYLIRVPEEMETCHQAAAWIAGFDDPDDYRPEVET